MYQDYGSDAQIDELIAKWESKAKANQKDLSFADKAFSGMFGK